MKAARSSLQQSLLSLALMAAFAAPGAYAASLTVDPAAADAATAADGKCSLREAVLSVNAGANVGDCVAAVLEGYGTNDTINLPAGTYTLTLAGLDEVQGVTPMAAVLNTTDATKGDLDLLKSVRIVGAGSATTTIQWDPAATTSAGADRIFHAYTTDVNTSNVNVVIEGVTLTNGKTFQVDLGVGPVSPVVVVDDPSTVVVEVTLPTTYYLRRAGGALAVGPAAAVVLVDPNVEGDENSEGRGGGEKPTDPGGETGAEYSLSLKDVKILANRADGDGGGIYTGAAMTATNVVISGNTSSVNGGGLYNEGNTSITNSTISANRAEGGGGAFLTGTQPVNFSGVTLSGNRAIGGGAISGRAGVQVNMVNSTISGNLADDVGAGFYSNGSAALRFVTIANNIAGADADTAGAGINVYPSGAVLVSLKNVLLSANKVGWDSTVETDGPLNPAALLSANCGYTGSTMAITSLGNNLSSDASCSTLIQGTDKNSLDPKIGELALNNNTLTGTWTHALLAGSPALGAGAADATVTLDQRGVTRDATPDIGAYEEPTPPVASGGGGGGGCTVNPNAQFEGGLLGLLAAAAGGLLIRRRRNDARG